MANAFFYSIEKELSIPSNCQIDNYSSNNLGTKRYEKIAISMLTVVWTSEKYCRKIESLS